MGRIGCALMIALLFAGLVTIVVNVQPVRASGTIYIRADGSVDPPTASITSVDNVTYTITADILDWIVVERSNIIVDGNGCTVQGSGSTPGFHLSSIHNATVKNVTIQSFLKGVNVVSSSLITISHNIIRNNDYGVVLEYSSNNTVTGNSITKNYDGVILRYSSDNTVSENNITANRGDGVRLWYSSNNIISVNAFVRDGLFVLYSYDNVVVDNSVNGEPLVYLEGVSDVVVEDAGQLILVRCNRIQAENLNLSHTTTGVQLWATQSTTLTGNTISENNRYGVGLRLSSNNTISGNNITNNEVNIKHSSNNNRFYHNSLTEQVFSFETVNIWDNGYPSGGNYWSDYNGADFYSGQYQNETGSDGIGDTPYIIDVNNQDNYPLMNPRGSLASLEYFLELYKQIVNEAFSEYLVALAEANARFYVKYGEFFAWNLTDYFGYRAGENIDISNLPVKVRDVLEYVHQNITSETSGEIFIFLNEMYNQVNPSMTESQIAEVFHQLYNGTFSGQQNYILTDGLSASELIELFNQDFNEKKEAVYNNWMSSGASEEDVLLAEQFIATARKEQSEWIDKNAHYYKDVASTIGESQNLSGYIFSIEYRSNPVAMTLSGHMIMGHSHITVDPFIVKLIGKVLTHLFHPDFLHPESVMTDSKLWQITESSGFQALATTTEGGQQSITSTVELFPFDLSLITQGLQMLQWHLMLPTLANATLDTVQSLMSIESFHMELQKNAEISEVNFDDVTPNDIISEPDSEIKAGKRRGNVTILNTGSVPLKPRLWGEIKALQNGMRPEGGVLLMAHDYPVLQPGENATIDFEYMVLLDYFSCVDFEGRIILEASPLTRLRTQKTGTFKAYDDVDACELTSSNLLLEGILAEGEEVSIPHSPDATLETVTYSLSHTGSVLNLHLYDDVGNHVGMNYTTGEVECQIANASHDVSDDREWITVTSLNDQNFTLEVFAVDTTIYNDSFSLVAYGVPQLPSILALEPEVVSLVASQPGTYMTSLIVTEFGGFNGLQNVTFTATDLSNGESVISMSNIQFLDNSLYVMAGESETASFTITIPENVTGGAYWGKINASTSENSDEIHLKIVLAGELQLANVTTSKTIVGQNGTVLITMRIENQGAFAITSNVTLCANMTVISSFSGISFASGNTSSLICQWNTTGVAKGNYTISAYVSPVLGEDYPSDNLATTWIFVTILGDVDGDRDVDIFDIVLMAGAYGTEIGDLGYLANYDIDGDGDIDIFDIVTACGHYGESW